MSLNWRDWTVPRHSNAEIVEEIAEKFEFFDDDVLVSTFHKCGTTVAQQMVSCLLHGAEASESRPLMRRCPFLDYASPVQRQAAMELGATDFREVARQLQRPRSMKTHLPPAYHIRHLKQQQGPKNVIVMRNPKDMLVSAFHHFTNRHGLAERLPSTFAEFWRNEVLHPDQAGTHDFFDFSLSWWSFRNHPRVLILFYEDIVRNKEEQFRKIADFLGVELSDELLHKSMEITSFISMQQNPNTNHSLVVKSIFKPGFNFIRKGEVGDWKNHFTVADNEMLDSIIADRLRGSDLQFVFE